MEHPVINMWPFNRKPTEERLKGLKEIAINGMKFKIKKINPLLDFHSEKTPQIFTQHPFVTEPPISGDPTQIRKIQKDMYAVIEAGIVEPDLIPVGKKGGISAEDLFRDPTMGLKLYYAIMEHSLNRFKGMKRLFFWTQTKFMLSMHYASDSVKDLQILSSRKQTQV